MQWNILLYCRNPASLQNDDYHWVASDFIELKGDTVKKDIRIGTAVLKAVIFWK